MINVALAIKHHTIRAEFEDIISSLQGFKFQPLSPHLPFDLLILEIGEDYEKEFETINSIQSSGLIKNIHLTSPHADSNVLIQAMRIGVKEYFSQPINKEEVKNAFLKIRDQKAGEQKEKGKIINIVGSKGGIGTTTVAVNLAMSLMEAKGAHSVALVDMNLIFGEIPFFLNIISAFNWGEVAKNIARVDSTYLLSVLAKHQSGLFVLPSPSGLDGIDVATPEVIEKILTQMQNVCDFIIIDSGLSLDDISLKVLEMSDLVCIVSILSLPCLANLKKLLWTFQKLGYPSQEKTRLIVNRYHKKSLISLKEAEETLNQKITWLMANDYQTTMAAINQGKPLSIIDRNAEITRDIRDLASDLLESEKGIKREKKGGLWSRIKK